MPHLRFACSVFACVLAGPALSAPAEPNADRRATDTATTPPRSGAPSMPATGSGAEDGAGHAERVRIAASSTLRFRAGQQLKEAEKGKEPAKK